MALSMEPAGPDRGENKVDSSLTLNFSSNNPFRNSRSNSPALPSPALPSPAIQSHPSPLSPLSAPVRPQNHNNPFLAAFEKDLESGRSKSPLSETMDSPETQKSAVGTDAKELLKRLTISEIGENQSPSRNNHRAGPPRGPNPRAYHSDEQGRRGPNGLRLPPRQRPSEHRENGESRRTRRNSDSSAIERLPLSEEERKRRERHRRTREARNSAAREGSVDGKSQAQDASKSRSSRRKRNAHIDVVDKLDVTGMYGTAGLFHHDGPFDACRPHRNRTRDTLAPMGAFPTNSANNTIGGSGPLNKGIDVAQFHGITREGFNDFASTERKPLSGRRIPSFDPTSRVEPIHGEETIGLGTSTFLEGAPASRRAIQRTESEHDTNFTSAGGSLTRKKSLAQRLRGMSNPRPRSDAPDGMGINPVNARYADRSNGLASPLNLPIPSTALANQSPDDVITAVTAEPQPEVDSFNNLHDDAYEKKGVSIRKVVEEGVVSSGEVSSPDSPRRPNVLERRATADSTGDLESKATGGGFLNRVKSLKGGRRARPERRDS